MEKEPIMNEETKAQDTVLVDETVNSQDEKKKKEKKIRTPEQKKKLHKRIRLIVILVIIVAIVGYFVYSSAMAASAPAQVEVEEAYVGSIQQTVKTSGTVATDNKKTYFAGAAAPVTTLNVHVGDSVKAGDVLMAYDTSDLDLSAKQAQLSEQTANGNYSDSIEKDTKSTEKYDQANADLPLTQAQIDTINAQIDDLNDKITEKKARMAQTAADLQKTLLDVDQDGKEDSVTDDDSKKTEENGKDVRLEIQESIQQNTYAQNNDKEIAEWNSQITELKRQLSDAEATKSDNKTDKTSGDSGKLTDGNKSALAATRQSAALTSQDTINDVNEAKKGVTAEFNGIVTDVKIIEGATTVKGTELFTIEDTDSVKVTINVTKYDLEKISEGQDVDITIAGHDYNGTVTKISKVATTNTSGASIVATDITINNPDEFIILGVQADVVIKTASAENAILVPIESVNSDAKGAFVYVLENGFVVRKDVTTGIANETEEQILSGLNEGDQVLTDISSDIVEGMPAVAATNAYAANVSSSVSSDAASSVSSNESDNASSQSSAAAASNAN